MNFSIYTKFIFLIGILFDIIITTIAVLLRNGKEGNQYINWIYPKELMIIIFILSNIIFIIILLYLHKKYYHKIFDYILFTIGFYRLFFCGFSWF